ncbi:YraN family protein [Xylanibacter caecicola]|uniref:YraN family protein n=1 Tax=Xylanibacter caecicola TaxID=2736294 RepID=UPI00258FCDC2|nr:YraN family protein [Xylanibacter caecicola]
MATHNDLGQWGEQKAAEYLEQKGLRIVDRNWRDGSRDIDIVAVDADMLVIVEVKTRRDKLFTEPETAVDRNKIRNICGAASKYVKMKHIDLPVRFDIVTIVGTADGNYKATHIEDAFMPIP